MHVVKNRIQLGSIAKASITENPVMAISDRLMSFRLDIIEYEFRPCTFNETTSIRYDMFEEWAKSQV
jgi:hypothetical protein